MAQKNDPAILELIELIETSLLLDNSFKKPLIQIVKKNPAGNFAALEKMLRQEARLNQKRFTKLLEANPAFLETLNMQQGSKKKQFSLLEEVQEVYQARRDLEKSLDES